MTLAISLQRSEHAHRMIILERTGGSGPRDTTDLLFIVDIVESDDLDTLHDVFTISYPNVTHVVTGSSLYGDWEEPDCLTVWEAAEANLGDRS